MLLSVEQIESYERDGYLLLPNYFSAAELEILLAEIPGIFGEDSPRRIKEKSGAVRTVFASHRSNEVYSRFSRLPRMIQPAVQLLGDDVYIHQFKINAKVAFEGDQWEWHQDFLYWHKEDAMPSPRVLTAVLFLQEANEFNGPMLVIPGSHREGMVETSENGGNGGNGNNGDSGNNGNGGNGDSHSHTPSSPAWFRTLTADLKYKVDKSALSRIVERSHIKAVKCPAGSVMFFHGNLFHASANNLSPWDRICVFVTYNSVRNALGQRENPRPEYIAFRDFSPVRVVEEGSLLDVGAATR